MAQYRHYDGEANEEWQRADHQRAGDKQRPRAIVKGFL
jgi:hypothetical protein